MAADQHRPLRASSQREPLVAGLVDLLLDTGSLELAGEPLARLLPASRSTRPAARRSRRRSAPGAPSAPRPFASGRAARRELTTGPNSSCLPEAGNTIPRPGSTTRCVPRPSSISVVPPPRSRTTFASRKRSSSTGAMPCCAANCLHDSSWARKNATGSGAAVVGAAIVGGGAGAGAGVPAVVHPASASSATPSAVPNVAARRVKGSGPDPTRSTRSPGRRSPGRPRRSPAAGTCRP